ncbi:hypothetical protein ACOMHN_009138 [Nucella lapillus]
MEQLRNNTLGTNSGNGECSVIIRVYNDRRPAVTLSDHGRGSSSHADSSRSRQRQAKSCRLFQITAEAGQVMLTLQITSEAGQVMPTLPDHVRGRPSHVDSSRSRQRQAKSC